MQNVNDELLTIASLLKDEWVTREQVRQVCASCADKMQQKGITRVKASVMIENIRVAYGWSKLPKGWTKESVKSFWDSLTDNRKHKVTACIKKLSKHLGEGHAGALCASLADMVDPGWRKRDK